MATKTAIVCVFVFGMFLWRPALLEDEKFENCIKTCDQIKDAELANAGSDINKFCQAVLNNNDCSIECGADPKFIEEITRDAPYFESCKLPFCAAGCTKTFKAEFGKLKLDQSSPHSEKMKICPHYETAFGCFTNCGFADAALVKLKKEAEEICGPDKSDDGSEDMKKCATDCSNAFNAKLNELNLDKSSPHSEMIKMCPHYETVFACFDYCGLIGEVIEERKKAARALCNVAPSGDDRSVVRKTSKSAAITSLKVCTQFLTMVGFLINAMI